MRTEKYVDAGIQWQLVAEYAAALLAEATGRVSAIKILPNAEFLKSERGTEFFRLFTKKLGPLRVKRRVPPTIFSRIREVFAACESEREFEALCRLRASGVDTVEPLAWGQYRNGSGALADFLIVRDLPDAVDPKSIYPSLTPRERRMATTRLAELTALIREGDAAASTVAPANLLIVRNELATGRGVYVTGTNSATATDDAARLADMADAFRSFTGLAGRIRFFRGYMGENYAGVKSAPAFIRRFRERYFRHMDRRAACAFKDCDDFECRRTNLPVLCAGADGEKFPVRIARARRAFGVEKALAAVGEHLTLVHDGQTLKSDKSTTVTHPDGVVAKEYRHSFPPKKHAWLARRAWISANRFFARTDLCPTPLACVTARGKSFLVSEYVANSRQIYEVAKAGEADPAFAAKLAAAVRRMHERGIRHNDLKSSNVLAVGSSGDWRFYFVDLDAADFHAEIADAARLENIVQLLAAMPEEFSEDARRVFVDRAAPSALRGENAFEKIRELCRRRNHLWPARDQ